MPHAHHAAFESFWVSAPLILVALVYVRGWVRIRRLDLDAIEGWRAGSFLLGLFFIWLAIASPLAALDHELLTAHMVQHLLLMTLAAPLIWLGAPVKPCCMAYRSDSSSVHCVHCSRSAPIQRAGKVLTTSCSLLAGSRCHAGRMAHSCVVCARDAIGSVACD